MPGVAPELSILTIPVDTPTMEIVPLEPLAAFPIEAHPIVLEGTAPDLPLAEAQAVMQSPNQRQMRFRRFAAVCAVVATVSPLLGACGSSVRGETHVGLTASSTSFSGKDPILNTASASPSDVEAGKGPESSASASSAVSATPTETSDYTNDYLYVGGDQFADSRGASVELTQEQPTLGENASHSLNELAVESTDNTNVVEVGWTVDPDLNGDLQPHLFVFHWFDQNGQRTPTCYNSCGFVQVSKTIAPGDPVEVGATGTYKVEDKDHEWQISYDGAEVGYFPESLWDGDFTRAGLIHTFAEVNAPTEAPCAQMGDGQFADSDSDKISNFTLIGATVSPSLSLYETNPSFYNYANATATGMNLGGPGAKCDGGPATGASNVK